MALLLESRIIVFSVFLLIVYSLYRHLAAMNEAVQPIEEHHSPIINLEEKKPSSPACTPIIVEYHENDPENPQNWALWSRWSIVMMVAMMYMLAWVKPFI